jgi:hypothetical protein
MESSRTVPQAEEARRTRAARSSAQSPTMRQMGWHIDWLESGLDHWWLRELRWRRQGRIS